MKSLLLLITILSGCNAVNGGWKRLPSLPDREGFAGCFAGVSNSALLVAGGANFPDAKPWEGGKKIWYDNVFVLENPQGQWKLAGKLSRPLGYGVSVTHKDGVVCVGGSDAGRHYADAFRLQWNAGELNITQLPPFPKPIANASGALIGDMLYVAGGLEKPDAATTLKDVYQLDLAAAKPVWQEVAPVPASGRMLALAAGFDSAFYLVGGVDLLISADGRPERRYLKDAFRFDPYKGWKRIADLPHPIAAAPSPAPTDSSGFWALGGDDGSQVSASPQQHRGFNRTILRYDAKTNTWRTIGELPATHVTTPCAAWKGRWIIPSGEIRPGVRSPQVWCWTPPAKE